MLFYCVDSRRQEKITILLKMCHFFSHLSRLVHVTVFDVLFRRILSEKTNITVTNDKSKLKLNSYCKIIIIRSGSIAHAIW